MKKVESKSDVEIHFTIVLQSQLVLTFSLIPISSEAGVHKKLC